MQIINQEEKVFGGRGISNGHRENPMGTLLCEITEGAVDPTGEDLLILIPSLFLVAILKSPFEEGGP